MASPRKVSYGYVVVGHGDCSFYREIDTEKYYRTGSRTVGNFSRLEEDRFIACTNYKNKIKT